MPESFECSVVTPEAQLFDAKVVYASIPAWDGQIGLMHQRAPLLVKLGVGALRLDLPDESTQSFYIAEGFAQMKDNRLTVIANHARASADISREEARAMLDEAQKAVPVGDEAIAQRQEQLDRARAMLAVVGE